MEITVWTYVIVCPLVFLAGLVDAVAGGGGLISLPAYLIAGLPTHLAAGTNKFANGIGTAVAMSRFMKQGKILLLPAVLAAAGALGGSWAGAKLALMLSDQALKIALLIIIPLVGIFLAFHRTADKPKGEMRRGWALYLGSMAIGFAIGCYDGFSGPGTGTFLILAFLGLLRMDLLTACGNTKVVNLASNAGAFVTFLVSGQVLFAVAVPAAAASIMGSLIGAKLALTKGARVIRPMFFVVLVLLLVKVALDLLGIF